MAGAIGAARNWVVLIDYGDGPMDESTDAAAGADSTGKLTDALDASSQEGASGRAGRPRAPLVVALMLLLGTVMLLVGQSYSRSRLRPGGTHTDIVREDLAELSKLLTAYREKHGRYPTNDEGLCALDTFESRFPAQMHRRSGAGDCEPGFLLGSEWEGFYRQSMEVPLDVYRAEHGRPPQSMQELIDADPLRTDFQKDPGAYEVSPIEVGLTSNMHVFLIGGGGVLSPWRMPYIYENHRGQEPAAFKGSIAADDDDRQWSVRVDDGVYISSMGEFYVFNDPLPPFTGELIALCGIGVMILAIVIGAVGCSRRRSAGKRFVMAGVLLAGTALGVSMALPTMCYKAAALLRRRPEMAKLHRELLDKYRAAGVITPETFARATKLPEYKAMEARKPDAATKPTTRPGDAR